MFALESAPQKFSNGPTPMMWVCKTLPKIKETQRSSNHCIPMRRSEDIVDQSLIAQNCTSRKGKDSVGGALVNKKFQSVKIMVKTKKMLQLPIHLYHY